MTRDERIIYGLGIVDALNSQGRVRSVDIKRLNVAKTKYDSNPSDENYEEIDKMLSRITN